ncbi:MAG: hypothetical protein JG782_1134 [Anaerophaga sp.]|nr:hypothetical protein [Anaerophaga sp.]MDI3520287.1 hypothetical protein [Anaerophaga sp.]
MESRSFSTVIATIIKRLAPGSIYAWIIFVLRLISGYCYSTDQT